MKTPRGYRSRNVEDRRGRPAGRGRRRIEQRHQGFRTGFDTGDPNRCDRFAQ